MNSNMNRNTMQELSVCWMLVVALSTALFVQGGSLGSGRKLSLQLYDHASSVGPKDFSTNPEDSAALQAQYEALVMAPAKAYGKVEKEGVPDFDDVIGGVAKQRADDALLKWMWEHVLGHEDGSFSPLDLGAEAPVASNCIYLFNPHYKFVFIKNTKVAGTSVGIHFGMFCKPNEFTLDATRKNCLWTHGDITKFGLSNLGYGSWEELWSDYTVFTLSRNPFDRAASSYHYCLKRRGAMPREGMCTNPTFKHFCQRPYILGLQSVLFKCMIEVPGGAGPKHDFGHVMPQATCLVNKSGARVYDWVLRIDNLSEDLEALCTYLNSIRTPGIMALPVKGLKTANANPTGSTHGHDYFQCGEECLNGVARYYKQDFELFGFPISLDAMGGFELTPSEDVMSERVLPEVPSDTWF